MTTITLIAALFGCLLLHSFVLSSTTARMPDSDLPFEFSQSKGSTITEDNVLTQSVSSDGKNVLKTSDPQPIKKYQSNKKNTKKLPKNQNSNKKQRVNNNAVDNVIKYHPGGHTSSSYYSSSPITDNQWNLIENFSKFIPGLTNMRIEYI